VHALPAPAVVDEGEPASEATWQAQSVPVDHVEPPMVSPSTMAAEPLMAETRPAGASRLLVVGALVTILLAGAVFTWRLQRDVRTAAQQAEQSQVRAQNAEAASRQAAEKQEAADRQLLAARDLATRAQTIGDVLAAPDLVRYTLTNPVSLPGVSGQVLWSRSRGFVFSASGLPAPPANTTYQIWLLTRGGAVGAATFVPDAAGRVTVTTTPEVARPVFGAVVTTEPKGGSSTPSGDPVLARQPVAPTPS
jgi:type II secretory pathway pseudopilin PulG